MKKNSTLFIFLAIILPKVCWFRDIGVKKKAMRKGFINIKANSNNKLHMLDFYILSSFNPRFPPTCPYCPNAFEHGENINSTIKCHLEAKVLCTVEGKHLTRWQTKRRELQRQRAPVETGPGPLRVQTLAGKREHFG